MWIPFGAAAAAGAVILIFAARMLRSRSSGRPIDVGPVSDAWLAEHRARGRDSM